MPEGSSSEAPVMKPGPSRLMKLFASLLFPLFALRSANRRIPWAKSVNCPDVANVSQQVPAQNTTNVGLMSDCPLLALRIAIRIRHPAPRKLAGSTGAPGSRNDKELPPCDGH